MRPSSGSVGLRAGEARLPGQFFGVTAGEARLPGFARLGLAARPLGLRLGLCVAVRPLGLRGVTRPLGLRYGRV